MVECGFGGPAGVCWIGLDRKVWLVMLGHGEVYHSNGEKVDGCAARGKAGYVCSPLPP